MRRRGTLPHLGEGAFVLRGVVSAVPPPSRGWGVLPRGCWWRCPCTTLSCMGVYSLLAGLGTRGLVGIEVFWLGGARLWWCPTWRMLEVLGTIGGLLL